MIYTAIRHSTTSRRRRPKAIATARAIRYTSHHPLRVPATMDYRCQNQAHIQIRSEIRHPFVCNHKSRCRTADVDSLVASSFTAINTCFWTIFTSIRKVFIFQHLDRFSGATDRDIPEIPGDSLIVVHLEAGFFRFSQMYCFGWVSTYTTVIKVNREPMVRW